MKLRICAVICMITGVVAEAQTQDSAALISTVTIDAYHKPAALMQSTKSVTIAGRELLAQNAPDRLLESINLLPGSKMEERSPGSYRLSVRGSTLRSPFGIRNVKMYLNDFIVTDASGNTYLNILDPELLNKIELYKGPEGADFGAVTGGTALLKTQETDQTRIGFGGGSYAHYKGLAAHSKKYGRHRLHVYSSYETTDSYRRNAALERGFLFLRDRYHYGSNQMEAMVLLSDLHYQTPGGLTLEQMSKDPRQARPGTSTLPSAEEQQAGIYNKMVLAGISNLAAIAKGISHFVAVQGSYSDFRNPFITNYEKRFEQNLAIRTHVNFDYSSRKAMYQSRIGFEGAVGTGRIRNFNNAAGDPAAAQNFDDITARSGFIFLSQNAAFNDRLFLDVSASLNLMSYDWTELYPLPDSGGIRFAAALLPSFGALYRLGDGFTLRAKLAKGNSAPTAEELRSSAQEINAALRPEYGWNAEAGVRKQWETLLFTEVSLFDFRLKNTIVRRQNSAGQEYFVNAGETSQRGAEFIVETRKLPLPTTVFSGIKAYLSGSFYDFTFKNYQKNSADFSGNKLTGVAPVSLQSLISLELFRKINLDIAHFYTGPLPLNDANTVTASSSLIGNMNVGYRFSTPAFIADLQLSVRNLYNTAYSLGYDLNAFGNRFYNPAATRNYMLTLKLQL